MSSFNWDKVSYSSCVSLYVQNQIKIFHNLKNSNYTINSIDIYLKHLNVDKYEHRSRQLINLMLLIPKTFPISSNPKV